MEYDFTLKFHVAAGNADTEHLVERLGEAGCDDALVGVGQPGRLALDFTREAESAQTAITSALADVKRAAPEARLVEVSPDLVGLTDVAELVGVTRQNMRKLMLSHAADFPAPVHDGSSALWHLANVLQWLKERGTYDFEQSVLDVARAAMQINLAKEIDQLSPQIRKKVRALLA
jgi:predicted DNA-binding transcriptional regulator AlpA